MMLAPRFAAIRGVWARCLPAQGCFRERTVHNAESPVETAGPVEPAQEKGMESFPDTGFLEFLEIVPAGPTAAQTQLGGQVVPRDAGFENEQDAGKDFTT